MLKNYLIKNSNVAELLRLALNSLLIQKEFSFNAEEGAMQTQEKPYLQPFYFTKSPCLLIDTGHSSFFLFDTLLKKEQIKKD